MEKFQDIILKIEKMTVAELAELIKALEQKFGVSAAAPVAAAGVAAGGEAAAEEKTAWNVLLKTAGGQKIQVIKVLKDALGIGLQESKTLADAAPKVVKEGLKKEDAEELKKKLEAVGATVELQ